MDAGLHQGEKRLQLRGDAETEEEEKVQKVQAEGPRAGPRDVRSVRSGESGRTLPRNPVRYQDTTEEAFAF